MSFALVALVIVFGAAVQGMTGFAFGMVSMALLPHLMPVKTATPLVAIVAFANVASILWQMRRSLDLRKARGLLVGTIMGVPVGVFFLARMDEMLVRRILAVVLVLAAIQGLLVRQPAGRPMAPVWGPFAGFLGGAIGGAFNIGGAPIVLYVYRQDWSKEIMIAVLQAVFFLSLLYRLGLYCCTGLCSGRLFLHGLLLLPFTVVGSTLGIRLQRKIDVGRLRLIVSLALVLMGLSLLR